MAQNAAIMITLFGQVHFFIFIEITIMLASCLGLQMILVTNNRPGSHDT